MTVFVVVVLFDVTLDSDAAVLLVAALSIVERFRVGRGCSMTLVTAHFIIASRF